MSICGFVASPDAAAMVVAWTDAAADADERRTFLCLETGPDGETSRAVRELLAKGSDNVSNLMPIDDANFVSAVLKQLRRAKSRLLVTAFSKLAASEDKKEAMQRLLKAASCTTIGFLYGEHLPSEVKRALVVSTGRQDDRTGVQLADFVRRRLDAEVTLGAVEDASGAALGKGGASYIRSILHDEALDEHDFEFKVTASNHKSEGIRNLWEDHDLILTGVDNLGRMQRLQESLGNTTVAVIKKSRLLSSRALVDWLPRINPSDHADLRVTLRIGSIWGPDFIAMLGLASAIASLGLLQNSPAVVIGSMLLAPLMTPMIGLGLALRQASLEMAHQCGWSIVRGFLLTLVVSFLIGVVTPSGGSLPDEVLARGAPNILDLLIAVFAAAAATFAMARPNIAGAIAGVAIATALVPPVCSVGISLAQGEWLNAFGAAALFFTNLIAIIVMSSFIFSLLGIKSTEVRQSHRRRAIWSSWGLVVVLLALVGPLSERLSVRLEEGKNVPLVYPVTQELRQAVLDHVARDEGVDVFLLGRPRAEARIVIYIASRTAIPEAYADDLRKIVRDQIGDPEIPVTVYALRGFWRSD